MYRVRWKKLIGGQSDERTFLERNLSSALKRAEEGLRKRKEIEIEIT